MNVLTKASSTHDKAQSPEWLALVEFAAPRADFERAAGLLQGPFRWPVLLEYAESHGITPRLAERVSNLDASLIPPDVRGGLREAQRTRTIFALQLTAELFHLLGHFGRSDLRAVVTKGPALSARCYGDPGARAYTDLDLIVRDADIRRATQLMLELSYEPRVPLTAIDARRIPGEYVFRKSGTRLFIDFHTERTFRYHPCRIQIEKLFQRRDSVSIDGRDVPVLSLEDELVLICVHGAKHFWERLMWIADVAALISSEPEPNWERAIAIAREVGAERILRLGLRLASDVLGAPLPRQLEKSVRSDGGAARLAEQIRGRLATSEPRERGILQRAAFRVRMRGGLLTGPAYLLRLSLLPTEEDWVAGSEGKRAAFLDAISRPFRLARKHSRRSSG